jgi:hypothetical protein
VAVEAAEAHAAERRDRAGLVAAAPVVAAPDQLPQLRVRLIREAAVAAAQTQQAQPVAAG